MLTEVPPELAELEDFNSMIAKYVEQLRILSEMRDTIVALFSLRGLLVCTCCVALCTHFSGT